MGRGNLQIFIKEGRSHFVAFSRGVKCLKTGVFRGGVRGQREAYPPLPPPMPIKLADLIQR